jgi:hypothetical protein
MFEPDIKGVYKKNNNIPLVHFMEKMTICFYQAFGGYANYYNQVWHNCPKCIPDEKNKQCIYYKGVTIYTFNVLPEASSQQVQSQDTP